MSDNMLTPEFRGCFVTLFKPRASKNDDGTTGAPKYSIKAAFPPGTDLSAMKRAAEEAAKEKWADKMPKALRSPFRTNEELDNPLEGIGDDWTVMTFSAAEDRRPGLVDAKLNDIINQEDVYSGAWFRAQVRPYAYDNKGNKGVAFGLQNVQKIRDDEPFGAARVKASQAFSAIEGAGESKSVSSIFG